MTKQKILASLKLRLLRELSDKHSLNYLRTIDPSTYLDTVIMVLYLYTRENKTTTNKNTFYMVDVVTAIGNAVRSKAKLKKNSGLSARTGAFILYTFEELGIIEVIMGQGRGHHQSYIISVLHDDVIVKLWNTIETAKVEKLPSETPPQPWASSRHPSGQLLVKTNNPTVLSSLTPENNPIVFDTVNKAQTTGWQINKRVFDLYSWALRNKTDAFADIWEMQNPEARQSKLREARTIGEIAKRFLGKTFYHIYSLDFRGRRYPATAYLHEQGSDLAKGLLLRADKKAIGVAGFQWLGISLASNWAGESGREDGLKTDKIPLADRAQWASDNEEILLSYAENPKVNQGWMSADKPWQFLAACFELQNIRLWQIKKARDLFYDDFDLFEDYSYESHLECFVDGSNNGSQHLSALTRDETTAVHVNLVPLAYPGDLYKYVAEHVWKHLDAQVEDLDANVKADCERFIDKLIVLKKAITATVPRSEERQLLIEEIREFKAMHHELMEPSCPVYWARVRDSKHRRKIVKR
jgi:DNA-directed RNA polymerase